MSVIEELKKYDDLYFNKGESPLSDTEYDLLRKKAKEEFPNDPYWTQVGHIIDSKFEKIKLPFVMGGLEEYNPSTVASWLEKEDDDVVASEKLDGNSIGCSWTYGVLSLAASRGDGNEGQNLINKIKYAVTPMDQRHKGFNEISLRGEVLLEGDLFKDLGMKNRRNAVTGILRRDEINPNVLSKFSVIYYELISAPVKLKTEVDRINFIKELGFKVARYIVIPKGLPTQNKIEILESFLEHVKETANYDIDGLVLTRNNSIRENVMSPKNKVKFKVNQLAVRCNVIGIEWNVTRVGYIKPVVLINPTEILGATVKRCSGFNYDFIMANKIGIGSEIGVVRSGDVIPYITEVYSTPAHSVSIPTVCPSCNYVLEKTDKELICKNFKCKQRKFYEVSHFFQKMGADGIQDKTIENIGIDSIYEFYFLTQKDLENLPGFGEKKAKNILNEVKKTLNVKPEQLLAAFGIPMIGRTLSRQLCSKFSIDDLFDIKDPNQLGLGDITSKTLIDNLPQYKHLYEFLKAQGLEFVKEDPSMKTLKGIKFALTGEGPMKRSELQKLIEAKGGEVGGISKNTNYLVTNDPDSTSGKMKSATKFGVPVINYDSLINNYLK